VVPPQICHLGVFVILCGFIIFILLRPFKVSVDYFQTDLVDSLTILCNFANV